MTLNTFLLGALIYLAAAVISAPIARQSRAEIERVFSADKGGETSSSDNAWFDEDGTKH